MDRHFHEKLLPNLCKKNTFIDHQIKTIKTALSTYQEAKQSIEDILLNVGSQPIGPNQPPPREILHNRTEQCPGRPSNPCDMEHICNYLIAKKTAQKENHDRSHNVRTLPDLILGQEVSFFSPSDPYQHLEGTITSKASTPRSCIIESQGKTYHHTCQHICPLHTPITRPYPSNDQESISPIKSTISRPSAVEQPISPIKSTISRPSAAAKPDPPVNPTISSPSVPKPIPASYCKFLTRPPQHKEPICTTAAHTTTSLNHIIAHLLAINQPHTTTMTAHPDPVPED